MNTTESYEITNTVISMIHIKLKDIIMFEIVLLCLILVVIMDVHFRLFTTGNLRTEFHQSWAVLT